MLRLRWGFVAALVATLWAAFQTPSPAKARGELDVAAWLRKPNVRLVVVEFYADWCAPCKAAVPKWKELHEKYRADGLRLIVVSVGESGVCTNPGWDPDQIVCDEDGHIGERFGDAASRLPQAFLYSWQGNRLAAGASVEQVEAAVERYFRETPRILVEEARDAEGKPLKDGAAIRAMAQAELTRNGKFIVVANEAERARLAAERKRVLTDPAYSDKGACQLGEEVSPNSILTTKRVRTGNNDTVVVELYSIEKGCMTATERVRVSGGNIEAAVTEAVGGLVSKLVGSRVDETPERIASSSSSSSRPAPMSSAPLAISSAAASAQRNQSAPVDDYERLYADIDGKKQAELLATQQAEARIVKAWSVVEKIGGDTTQPAATRIALVHRFIADFESTGRPEVASARKLLKFAQGVEGMVLVPGGPFQMGCNGAVDSECGEDEKPSIQVFVSTFLIDRTEVKTGDYIACVRAGQCKEPDTFGDCNAHRDHSRDDHPINCVDWDDAVAYCTWKGKRLPTEAEWEKAARGTDGRLFPWGNSVPACEGAVLEYCRGSPTERVGVRQGGASPYGALDMIGNVWEWVADWYDDSYYATGPSRDPVGPSSGKYRVLRGGSWNTYPSLARSSRRDKTLPANRHGGLGFRCAQ